MHEGTHHGELAATLDQITQELTDSGAAAGNRGPALESTLDDSARLHVAHAAAWRTATVLLGVSGDGWLRSARPRPRRESSGQHGQVHGVASDDEPTSEIDDARMQTGDLMENGNRWPRTTRKTSYVQWSCVKSNAQNSGPICLLRAHTDCSHPWSAQHGHGRPLPPWRAKVLDRSHRRLEARRTPALSGSLPRAIAATSPSLEVGVEEGEAQLVNEGDAVPAVPGGLLTVE